MGVRIARIGKSEPANVPEFFNEPAKAIIVRSFRRSSPYELISSDKLSRLRKLVCNEQLIANEPNKPASSTESVHLDECVSSS